ncbi:unnamed protein product, partial [Prorocentrum cordatum]
PDRLSVLKQAPGTSTDPLLAKLVADKISKIESEAKPRQSQAEEALRNASGVWRDASLKHKQAVNAAVEAQDNLANAQQRERETALTLAKAEAARRLSAQGMAKELGITPASEVKEVLFEVKIDEAFFHQADDLDIEASDRQALKGLEQELRGAKMHMGGKRAEVKSRQKRTTALRQEIDERL